MGDEFTPQPFPNDIQRRGNPERALQRAFQLQDSLVPQGFACLRGQHSMLNQKYTVPLKATVIIKHYLRTQVPPLIFSSWFWIRKPQESYVPVKPGQDKAHSPGASYIFLIYF